MQDNVKITAKEIISKLPEILKEDSTLKYKIYAILEEHFPSRQEYNRILEEIEKSRIEANRRFEEINKRFEAMQQEMDKRFEEINKRFEEINKRFEAMQQQMDKRFNKVEASISTIQNTLQKITLDIEEEAREVINYVLRKKNINIVVDRFEIPDVIEIDIYGCNKELCVIGECSVRAGINMLDKLERDIKKLKENAPEEIKGKVIKVIYTSLPTNDLVEAAKKRNVWVFRGEKEVTEFVICDAKNV